MSEYLGFESMTEEWKRNLHNPKRDLSHEGDARYTNIMILLEEAKALGYNRDHFKPSQNAAHPFGIILKACFKFGGGPLKKTQRELLDNIREDIRRAVFTVFSGTFGENVVPPPPEVIAPAPELLPEPSPIILSDDEEGKEVEGKSKERKVPKDLPGKEFSSAAEANAALAIFESRKVPGTEPEIDPELAELFGLKETQ